MTDGDAIAFRLRYDEGCFAAHALNVIGDRWALLVVRELMFRPKRFQALRRGIPGVSAAVLTQRLQQLCAAHVVAHDADLGTYSLTNSGKALRPVLAALCNWGSAHPGHDPTRFISPTALMISMGTKCDREAARDCPVAGAFVMGREGFSLSFDSEGDLLVAPRSRDECDFKLEGTANALARLVYGSAPVSSALSQLPIEFTGDVAACQTFVDLFDHRRGEEY